MMKRTGVAVFAVIAGLSLAAIAQAGKDCCGDGKHGGMTSDQKIEKLSKKLKLTDEQKAQGYMQTGFIAVKSTVRGI